MAYIPRSQGEILSNLKGSVIGRTKVDDVNIGSTLYNLINSFAGEIASIERRLFSIREQFFLNGAEGQDLDDRVAELPPLGLGRISKTNASGSVLTVTRATTTEVLTIPIGSSVLSSDGTKYVTTVENIFGIGNPSLGNVHILCSSVGVVGNKLAGEITVIDNMPSDITSVHNTSPLSNGLDAETDEDLRTRAYEHLKSLSRCQRNAIETMALSFIGSDGDRFRYARIFEDPFKAGYSELVCDDGTGMDTNRISRSGAEVTGTIPSGGSYFIYHEAPAINTLTEESSISINTSGGAPVLLNSSDYTSIPERGIIYFSEGFLREGYTWKVHTDRVFRGLIKEIQDEIEGDVDDSSHLTGFRAVGTRIRVIPPETQPVSLGISLRIQTGRDQAVIEQNVSQNTSNWISSLNVGEPLYISKLIDIIINIEGVVDVKIFQAGSLTERMDNVVPASSRIVLRPENIQIISTE